MFRGTWSAVSGEVEGNNEGRARRDQDCSADGGRSAGPQREHGKGSRDEVFRLTRSPRPTTRSHAIGSREFALTTAPLSESPPVGASDDGRPV
jgi:hypothetical protein